MRNYENDILEREQSIKMQARESFFSARHQASWNRLRNRLSRKSNHLTSFEDAYGESKLSQQHDIGTYPVAIEQITGSMGRVNDFDRDFFPCNSRNANRWMRIAIAFHKGIGLPAVQLYKIGDCYFVKDGNHRISVAAAYGQAFIDASVTEILLD